MPKLLDRALAKLGYVKAEPEAIRYYTNADGYGHANERGGGHAKLTFAQLRAFADSCDAVRNAIDVRTAQIIGTALTFIPVDGIEEDVVQDEIKQAKEFITKKGGLGGPGVTFQEFMGQIIEDLLVCGCCAIYRRRTRGKKIFSLEPIDAATIKPLQTEGGWTPQPPEIAYEQYVGGRKVRAFNATEIHYRRLNARTHSRWGMSPTEYVVGAILQYLGYDAWNLSWVTDGDGDIGHWEGPQDATPEERKQFDILLKKLRSTLQTRQRGATVSLPYGFRWVPRRERKEGDFEGTQTFLIRRIAAAFRVNATVLGFAGEQYKVSTEEQIGISEMWGEDVFKLLIKSLLDDILHDDLGLTQIQAQWDDDDENLQEIANTINTAGTLFLTPNEGRQMLGLPILEGGLADSLFIMTASGPAVVWGDNPTPQQTDPKDDKNLTPDADDDLQKWKRKALKYHAEGKLAKCEFYSDVIPPGIMEDVRIKLEKSQNAADIQAAFFIEASGGELSSLTSNLERLLRTVRDERGRRKGWS